MGANMKKQQAIDLFSPPGSPHPVKDLAEAIGVSSQAISQWQEELTKDNIKRIKHIVDMRVMFGDKALGRRFKKLQAE